MKKCELSYRLLGVLDFGLVWFGLIHFTSVFAR